MNTSPDAGFPRDDAAIAQSDGSIDPADAGDVSDAGVPADADVNAPDGSVTDGSIAGPGPEFAGVSFGFSDTPTQVVLRWLPAVDDTTDHSQIRYLVLQGTDPASLSATPVAEVTGATEISVGSLTADTQYYFQVVAEDADGTLSEQKPAVGVMTLDTAIVVNTTPKDIAGLGITVVENGLNDFTLSGAGASGIVANDLIIIDNSFGRSLRRVVSATPSGGDVNIITQKASMDDVFDGGSIRASGVLVDPVGMAPSRRRVTLWSRNPVTSQVPVVSKAAGDNIKVETRAIGKPAALFHAPVTLDSGVTLDFTTGFQPSFETDAKFDDTTGSPRRLRAVAKGKFTLDATAAYNLTAAAQVKAKKELFSKKYTFTYALGGVPVVQDVELKLFAEANFNFQGAIDATAVLHAEKTLAFGFQWTAATGFQLIKEEGFDRTITYNLTGEAEAKGALKIYPVISTTFYKVATAALSVTPTLTLDAKARFIPTPPEITKFDVTFLVSAQVSADVTILGLELLKWKSDEYRLIEIPIHSQPELTIRSSRQQLDTCGKRKLYLQVADGYNNQVDLSTIQWSVEPSGPTITTGGNPLIVEFEAPTAGTYTVTASGHGLGFLGALGVRYANLDVTVVDAPPGDCDPVNSEGDPVLQCLTNPLTSETGMFGAPLLNATMYAPGDTVELSLFGCPNGCWFDGYTYRVENHPDLSLIDYILLHDPTNIDPDDDSDFITASPDSPHVISFPLPDIAAPGQWVIGGLAFEETFLGGQFFSRYGENGSTYELFQNRQSGPAEFCDNAPTPFPVPYFNVIADDGRDGNDSPEDAVELAINGGKTVQTVAGIDSDWFQISPTTEGGLGAAFDSDVTYDPECYVTINIANDSNLTGELCAYSSLADAEAGTNALICYDGPITFQTTAGQSYYVSVAGSALVQTYEIEAASSCDDPLDIYPRMTSTPQLSQNPINAGTVIDITVDFTNNTNSVRTVVRNDSGSAGSTSTVSITPPAIQGVTMFDTWLANLSSSYWVNVTLTSPDGHEARYTRDPAVSTTNYAVTYDRADGFSIENVDSGIPLVFLQTN